MWYKVVGRKGAVVSCEQVAACKTDGLDVLYLNARNKADACSQAVSAWRKKYVERVSDFAKGKPGNCPDCGRACDTNVFCPKCSDRRAREATRARAVTLAATERVIESKGVPLTCPRDQSALSAYLDVRSVIGVLTPKQFSAWLDARISSLGGDT